VEENFKLSKTV